MEGKPTGEMHYRYDEAILTATEYEEFLGDIQSPSTEGIMQVLSDIQLAIDSL